MKKHIKKYGKRPAMALFVFYIIIFVLLFFVVKAQASVRGISIGQQGISQGENAAVQAKKDDNKSIKKSTEQKGNQDSAVKSTEKETSGATEKTKEDETEKTAEKETETKKTQESEVTEKETKAAKIKKQETKAATEQSKAQKTQRETKEAEIKSAASKEGETQSTLEKEQETQKTTEASKAQENKASEKENEQETKAAAEQSKEQEKESAEKKEEKETEKTSYNEQGTEALPQKNILKLFSQEEYEDEYKATKLRIKELKEEIESLEVSLEEMELYTAGENSMNMEISARLEGQMEPEYMIIIPSQMNVGELSRDMDTTIPYSMTVEMKDGESGYIEISTEENGRLIHDDNSSMSIKFVNKFGTKKVIKTGTESSVVLDSEIFVKAGDVKYADAGEYTGIMSFDIRHFTGGTGGENNGNGTNKEGGGGQTNNNQNNTQQENKNGTNKINEEIKEKRGRMTARVSLRKESDFDELSMADKLFYDRADLDVGEKETELTLYVIDPVPKYTEEGTPIKNVKFLYSGDSYKASVKKTSETKEFAMAEGFIEAEGKYPVSKVTAKVPNDAIWNSVDGVLKCEAYVNAVMKSTQTFYVVLDDFEGGKTKKETETTIKLEDAEYIADVSIMEGKSKKKTSKYNVLFSDKADISVSGDNATLSLYFIDPVPKYKDDENVFSDAVFTYSGSDFDASIEKDASLVRKYNKAEEYIEKAGNYGSSKMKVVLSKEAVSEANNGKLQLKFHIKAGSDKDETVTVYLKNFKLGSTKNSAKTPDGETPEEKPTETAANNAGTIAAPAARAAGKSVKSNKSVKKAEETTAPETEAVKTDTVTKPAAKKPSAPKETGPTMFSAKSGTIAEVLKLTVLVLGSVIGYGVKQKFF